MGFDSPLKGTTTGKVSPLRGIKRGPASEEARRKMREIARRGPQSRLWRGGIKRRSVNVRIETPEWKALRKTIYARDQWRCVVCGKPCANSQICHHIIPVIVGGSDDPLNLATFADRVTESKSRYSELLLISGLKVGIPNKPYAFHTDLCAWRCCSLGLKPRLMVEVACRLPANCDR